MSDELLNKLLAKVVNMDAYMREHLVTRDEFSVKNNELMTHVDGFVKLHETLDQELVFLRNKVDLIEDRVQKLEARFA